MFFAALFIGVITAMLAVVGAWFAWVVWQHLFSRLSRGHRVLMLIIGPFAGLLGLLAPLVLAILMFWGIVTQYDGERLLGFLLGFAVGCLIWGGGLLATRLRPPYTPPQTPPPVSASPPPLPPTLPVLGVPQKRPRGGTLPLPMATTAPSEPIATLVAHDVLEARRQHQVPRHN
jgi:hypothetical protein